MSAIVNHTDGTGRQLDVRKSPDEVVKATDVEDSNKLARLLTRILGDVAEMRRRFFPRRTTFREIHTTGDSVDAHVIRLAHRFGSAVEWWLVGVNRDDSVVFPFVTEDSSTDDDTLVLKVYFTATISIRVEEAG